MSEGKEISAVVHELAGILSSLQGFAEIVEKRKDHPQREEFISIIRRDSRRAARALKDLQILRALEGDRFVDIIEPIALDDVLRETQGQVEHPRVVDAALRGLEHELPPVVADRDLLAELLARTVDLSGSGGRVTATLSADGDHVEVKVAFDAGVHERELTRGLDEGHGPMRALALARHVLARWDGRVRVDASESAPYVILALKAADR